MKPGLATSFGWPFLLTLVGVGLTAALGSCDGTTSCQVKSFVAGPIMLVLVVITGFVAGRFSSSTPIGLVAMLAGTALVVGLTIATDLWYQPPDPEAGGAEGYDVTWLLLVGLAIVLMLPGFLFGRDRYKRAEGAALEAMRADGTITPDEFTRQMALRGQKTNQDQAPPDHVCGRCGKPLSPVWHGACKHCGASYIDYPPVSRLTSPDP